MDNGGGGMVVSGLRAPRGRAGADAAANRPPES